MTKQPVVPRLFDLREFYREIVVGGYDCSRRWHDAVERCTGMRARVVANFEEINRLFIAICEPVAGVPLLFPETLVDRIRGWTGGSAS